MGVMARAKGKDAAQSMATKDFDKECPAEKCAKEKLLSLRILSLWQDSVPLFAANLPVEISRTELEAMFWRAGRIIDSFMPVDRSTGKK